MQVQDIISGFEVKRVRRFDELDGTLWEMEHRKTGAQLCWLDRPDENKTFSIAFKTLPEDSTGVSAAPTSTRSRSPSWSCSRPRCRPSSTP